MTFVNIRCTMILCFVQCKTKFTWDATTNDTEFMWKMNEEKQQIKLNKRCTDSEYHGSQIGRVCFHSIWNDSGLGIMLHLISLLSLSNSFELNGVKRSYSIVVKKLAIYYGKMHYFLGKESRQGIHNAHNRHERLTNEYRRKYKKNAALSNEYRMNENVWLALKN